MVLSFEYNWDNKLRSATAGGDSLAAKYDEAGNRVITDSNGTKRRYVLDTVGRLPVVLLELDPDDSYKIKKAYYHALAQVLRQTHYTNGAPAGNYFYLHDRLGSTRLVLDSDAAVKNTYTYDPFGRSFASQTSETIANPFQFAGQFFDEPISQYHLRARQYDPALALFTTRDPVLGDLEEPLTLHAYLYCANDPVNATDPTGEMVAEMTMSMGQRAAMAATATVTALLLHHIAQEMLERIEYRTLGLVIMIEGVASGVDGMFKLPKAPNFAKPPTCSAAWARNRPLRTQVALHPH